MASLARCEGRPMMDEDSPRPDSPDEAGAPRLDDAISTNLQHVLIKWTGSKRRQASQMVVQFSRKIATYYDPFLGCPFTPSRNRRRSGD